MYYREMDVFNINSLRASARRTKVPDYAKLRKVVLTALQNAGVTLETLRVAELRSLAKIYRIPNYSALTRDHLLQAISDAINQPEMVSRLRSFLQNMKGLDVKILRILARDHGVKDYAKMRKEQLQEALQNIEIILDNLRVEELRDIAKPYGVANYKSMRKDALIAAITDSDKNTEMIPIPVWAPQKPQSNQITLNFTTLDRLVEQAEDRVLESLERFTDWVKKKFLNGKGERRNKRRCSNKKLAESGGL